MNKLKVFWYALTGNRGKIVDMIVTAAAEYISAVLTDNKDNVDRVIETANNLIKTARGFEWLVPVRYYNMYSTTIAALGDVIAACADGVINVDEIVTIKNDFAAIVAEFEEVRKNG